MDILRKLVLVPFMALAAGSAPAQPPADEGRVIVTFKAQSQALRMHPLSAQPTQASVRQMAQQRADALSGYAGAPLRGGRMIDERTQVVLAAGLDGPSLAQRLASHPDVAQVTVDRRKRALYVPSDPLFQAGPPGRGPEVGQWYLRQPTPVLRSAIDAQGAWNLLTARGVTGSGVVVAVVDTGVLTDHVDLSGRVLPGHDMISDANFDGVWTANDGDGRDPDASDPGDWVTPAEDTDPSSPGYGCGAGDSSWHGTMVAGVVGALADNGVGMVGTVGPLAGPRVLPVRVLGKCGGWDSDVLAGMRWAAGLSVPGVPANPNPARVVNVSLGGSGVCRSVYQTAVQEITALDAVVVAAAGNSVGRAVGEPANCPGVIAVGGLRHAGSKVGFSDLGPEITISAPGGNCVNIGPGEPCLYSIITPRNRGTRGPVAGGSTWSDAYDFTVGTSFAAPMVSGTVAMMLAAQPGLTPQSIVSILRSTARPFPTSGADNGPGGEPVTLCRAPDGTDQLQCYCVAGLCGAGMLDAAAAVQAALPATPPETPSGGRGGGVAGSAAWLAALAMAAGALRRHRRHS